MKKSYLIIIFAVVLHLVFVFLFLSAIAFGIRSCHNSRNDDKGKYTRDIITIENGMKLEYLSKTNSYSLYSRGECEETEIVIPSTYNDLPITSIGSYAFSGYEALTHITIPSTVTHIYASAFARCHGLTEVELPESLTYMGEDAFRSCESLTTVFLSESLTHIGGGAFSRCDNLQFNIYDNAKYLGSENNPYLALIIAVSTEITECVINPNTKILSEGNYFGGAFQECKKLTNITVPDSVTNIGRHAFEHCISLKEVTIGNGVKEIEEGTFENCSSLVSITLPDGITRIGDDAFKECVSLETFNFPKNLETIGDCAFENCVELKSIYLYENVVDVDADSFKNCSGLESITVSEGNSKYKSIDNCLLTDGANGMLLILGCKNSVIPEGVTAIFRAAFYCCKDLTNITLPSSLEYIDSYAFYECSGLTSVKIQGNVGVIDEYAFYGCSALTEILFSDGLTKIGERCFDGCVALEMVVLPVSVTHIEVCAFDNCDNLIIIYRGTVKQWNSIKKGHRGFFDSSKYTGKYTVRCTDGEIEEPSE